MRYVVVLLLAVGLVGMAAPLVHHAAAELLVYEGFDYEAGASLEGLDGGLGFASAWTAGGEIVADSIAYTDENDNMLPTTGNHALISASGGNVPAYRDLTRNYGADATFGPGTYWVSFLGQRLQPHPTLDENSIRSIGFQLHNGTGTDSDERLTAGRATVPAPVPSTGWALFSDGTDELLDESSASMHELSFVVMQVDIADSTDSNNSDSAAMWINPNLDGPLPAADAELSMAAGNNFDYLFERVRLWAGGTNDDGPYAEWIVDEIRIGSTVDDVLGATFLLGDTNGDGMVDELDLTPIRNNYRRSVSLRSEGDLNGDLFVDFRDFRQWKTEFLAAGNGSLAEVNLGFLTIPEPATAWLLVLAGLFGWRWRYSPAMLATRRSRSMEGTARYRSSP